MDVLWLVGLPVAVGVLIGVLSGLLGIGGGTIMVPVFRLAFGLSPLVSTATSLFTIIPTSISGAVSHLKGKTCVPALGLAMGIGRAFASPVGVWLSSISPAWLVMLAAALIIGYSAANMLVKAARMPSKKQAAARSAVGGEAAAGASSSASSPAATAVVAAADAAGGATAAPADADGAAAAADADGPAAAADADGPAAAADAIPKLSRKQLLIGAAIGLGAGLMSGYVGVGGGFIMVPLMLSLIHIPMKLASGTSLIAILILAIPGTIENGIAGNIDYLTGISVAVGSIPGAVLGAYLVKRVPERVLRFVFGGFLVIAAALLFLNEFGILG